MKFVERNFKLLTRNMSMMSEIMYTLKGALLDLIDGFYNWKNIHLRYILGCPSLNLFEFCDVLN